jgi:hypothetical protein
MKLTVFIVIFILALPVHGQFKNNGTQQPSVKDGIISGDQNFLFGFLNSENFLMRHSFNASYSSFAGQGISLTSYTNSMFYRISDDFNMQLDISAVYSPYNTLGEQFQKNLSGIYISNAALNYRPWKDFSVHLQYRNMPYGYGYYNPFYGYYSPFLYDDQNLHQQELPLKSE